jgi:hypothetical protein
MPLDTSLFNDVNHCVKLHVVITEAMPETDEHKFSLTTPNRVASTYLRILDRKTGGSPSSERILQDCKKIIDSLLVIRKSRRGNVRWGW